MEARFQKTPGDVNIFWHDEVLSHSLQTFRVSESGLFEGVHLDALPKGAADFEKGDKVEGPFKVGPNKSIQLEGTVQRFLPQRIGSDTCKILAEVSLTQSIHIQSLEFRSVLIDLEQLSKR